MPEGDVKVSVDFKNVGSREGDEVVQLYIHPMNSAPPPATNAVSERRRIGFGKENQRGCEVEVSEGRAGVHSRCDKTHWPGV